MIFIIQKFINRVHLISAGDMVVLSTLIIGNRQTDALLKHDSDLMAMERFPKVDKRTFEDKLEHGDANFKTDLRTIEFLEMHGLIRHSSPHDYEIAAGYFTAKRLLEERVKEGKPFDTMLVYRLVDANGADYSDMDYETARQVLMEKRDARDIIKQANGSLVVLLMRHEKRKEEDAKRGEEESHVVTYQRELIREIISENHARVIVSYALDFRDAIKLNNDIGKRPSTYCRARGTRVLNSVEDYLNKNL